MESLKLKDQELITGIYNCKALFRFRSLYVSFILILASWTKLEIAMEAFQQNQKQVASNQQIHMKKKQKMCQITNTRKILSMLQWIKGLPV